MIIIIPGKLPGLNEVINANRRNKYAGSTLKKDVEESIIPYIKSQCRQSFERISISINWYEPNQRRDYDNISSATKFILDSLVKCDVIPNDGWRNIVPDLHHRFYIDKENPRIELEIHGIET